MKKNYKGYEIEVTRGECGGGWDMLYYSVYRESDGLEVVCSFENSNENVRDMVESIKGRVAQFIETKGRSECLEDDFLA